MANVRIKDLTTTAATTASDDFFGVDGATNGTRKLNAFSPTFGGNLTVSGTGTSSVAGKLAVGTTAVIGNSQFTLKKATNKNLNIDAAAGAVSGISIYAGTDADAYTGLQVDGDKLYLNARSGGNVLIGTTTDGGQKLQVNGTAYVSGDATFAGTVTTTGLVTVTGTTASIANGATADIALNTPSSLVSYYVRSEGNSNDQSSGFYRSNNNGASSAFVLFGQNEANVAVTTPAAGTIRITNNTGGTIAFAYAFTVLVKR